ncbi:AMP-binding protein [Nonomuraea sp. MG754425]|uniref:AMP-binding protein n=1 Tax=Nonomuraea sp. MG754425 TaxID=2570319 RepID=UPI001F196C54|nr:AMP-binding protein [Nonomuraea sp. MG754425]
MTDQHHDDVTAAPETMFDLLERRAAVTPGAGLARFADGRALGVGECHDLAVAAARGLARLIAPGDHVLTCLEPGPELVSVVFALARLGAVEVPLALDARRPAAGTARTLIAGADVLRRNPGLLTFAATMDRVVLVDGEPGVLPRAIILDDLLADRRPLPRHRPAPADPAVVMATSGTTGRAKGALLPHFAGVRHARRVVRSMGYTADDVLLNVFPWNHINVRHAGLLPALISGAVLVVRPRFSASRFWQTCRTEGVSAFNFMGAMAAILERTSATPYDTGHRVRRAYGGPAPAALARRFRERFGVELLEAYACTELGDVAAGSSADHRPGAAGRPVPEYEVVIRDDDGRPVPCGRPGQITVRPRTPWTTFSEYVGDPAATRAVVRDGWFHTGDRGRFDEDGFLHFAGRRADVVRRRGENIATWEVERVVAAMPGVLDAAAVGVPSELTEEELLVAVAVAGGAAIEPRAVRAWCLERLPRHAVPRYVRVLGELPRNTATKVVKGELRDQGVTADTWDADRGRAAP